MITLSEMIARYQLAEKLISAMDAEKTSREAARKMSGRDKRRPRHVSVQLRTTLKEKQAWIKVGWGAFIRGKRDPNSWK